MSEQRIQQYFTGSAALLVQWAGSLSAPIAAAAQTALECVTNGGKVLTCGSAAAAALAQYAHPASSGHASLALAVQAAHEREMPVIAMTGEGEAADALGSLLLAADTHIAIAHAHAASVLHVQQLALHCICESLDALLLGDE